MEKGKTVKVKLSPKMYQDLEWLIDHFKSEVGETNTIEDIIVNLVDDVIDIWFEDHSGTGVCANCAIARGDY